MIHERASSPQILPRWYLNVLLFFFLSCHHVRLQRKADTKSTSISEGNQLFANKSQPLKISGHKTFLNSLYTSSAGKSLNILFIVYVSEKYANIAKETTKRQVIAKKDIFSPLVCVREYFSIISALLFDNRND